MFVMKQQQTLVEQLHRVHLFTVQLNMTHVIVLIRKSDISN